MRNSAWNETERTGADEMRFAVLAGTAASKRDGDEGRDRRERRHKRPKEVDRRKRRHERPKEAETREAEGSGARERH